MRDEKVPCRTPNPEKSGVTQIPAWKFHILRSAILAELENGDVPFAELASRVDRRLTGKEKQDLGSLGWHVTTVKLELEVRGEVSRVSDVKPQLVTLG